MPRNDWKVAIHERDCYKCKICGSTTGLTVHHKLPVARGGKSNSANCVCWCTTCHRNYNRCWGLTESDDFGNPVGEFRSVNKPHRKRKRR